nr:immunoglobulin light chain junction region [Macaca mulatta]
DYFCQSSDSSLSVIF